MKLSMTSRNEVIAATQKRYQRASKKEKGLLLAELEEITGLSRDRLARRLRSPIKHVAKKSPAARLKHKKQGRKPRYGKAHQTALLWLWDILGYIASKRFVQAIPPLLDALARFDQQRIPEAIADDLRHISARTIDRLLAFERKQFSLRGRCVTKPGTLLKSQIPIRRGTDWDDTGVGFCEIDLVAHCGASTRGEFVFTLTVTDVKTGWTECVAIINKAQRHVFRALLAARTHLPFSLKGIDSDNGSEFINHELLRYCQEDLVFTRSRSETSNDGCYVEQKNGSVVRQHVGYQRFEGERPVSILNEYYEQLRLLNNFFLPSAKLIEKQRDGAIVKRKHDQPQTPYQRVLDADDVSFVVKSQLRKT